MLYARMIAGIIGAVEVSAVLFWGFLVLLGETQGQLVLRGGYAPLIFGVTVPLGALLGIQMTLLMQRPRQGNIFKSTSWLSSWLWASLIGYPFAFVFNTMFAFSLTGALPAAIAAMIVLVLTLGFCWIVAHPT